MKISLILVPFVMLFRGLRSLLAAIFGRFAWQSPLWLGWIGRKGRQSLSWAASHRLAAAALLFLTLALTASAWYGWQWYTNLPVPHTVGYQVEAPGLTDYEKTPIAIAPLRVRFDESVAPLALVGTQVATGVQMEPAHPGEWRWADDRTLEFIPKGDWPIAGAFSLRFAKKGFFTGGVLLAEYNPQFQSAPFTVEIRESELYQDPVDSNLKKMVATVRFSHPVEESGLQRAIGLKLGEGLKYRDTGDKPWTLQLDKSRLQAHVHSAPLAVPLESVPITLSLNKGLRAAAGGNATESPVEQTVTVPGRYRLSFSNQAITYVDNEQGEPEQVLMFDSTFAVVDEVIRKYVRAWLLPEHLKDRTAETLTEADLGSAEELPLTQIASIETLNSHHSFKIHVPIKRRVYLEIAKNVEAVGGYLSKNPESAILETGEYPKVLKLMGDGALLSLNGEKQIGIMAQGIPGVKVEIARLLPNQLHQLVDQNNGNFSAPSVYGENFDRLVEREEYTHAFGEMDPAKPIYDSIDLSFYLSAQGGRHGVFVLRLTPFDPRQPKREYSDHVQGSDSGDRRFILVTDLGIISKRTQGGGQEVFVQSIATGAPVAGAKVEVLGRNGLPVAQGLTDAEGRTSFPQMGDLRREKTPIMLVASMGNDLSFLPVARQEHRLDLTRFDIGGVANQNSPDQISAYLFSDRGLYRPGETAHIGFILRTADWSPRIEGMPVEVEITDPRGIVAFNERRNLPQNGLDAVDFASSETAAAGEYTASVYLIKNTRRDNLLGSVAFKVQDFEPDRMKVSLRFGDAPVAGWLRPGDVKARVKALHLFGANASSRRVASTMEMSPSLPAFEQYPDYRFHVDGVLQEGVEEDLPEATTDEQGEAALKLNLERFAGSTYRLRLTAKVYEAEGGRNVAAEQDVLVSGAPYLVGVSSPDPLEYVNRDAVRKTHWLAVGPDLQPVAAEKLSLTLLEYRYVSVLVKQGNGTYKYESRQKELVRDNTSLSLPKEGGEIVLPTGEPGDFAYELRNAEGELLNRVAWSVAGAGNLSRSLERNAELQIKLDKASYAPGETITINLRAPYTGAGLITIERDKVYAHAWFKTDTTSSVQTIVMPAGVEGNAYVNVQFVRDPGSPEVYMSPLSYGVAPFMVALDSRRLPLKVTAPAVIEPGQTLDMQVVPGEAAKAVLFAVDEGILQVARYKTPDPLGHFFQKRALEVETSQILSLILPEFSRLLNAAAPGGDGEDAIGSRLNPFKRKRQGPVAYWSGVVDIPAEGRTFSYTVPDSFNGRLRLMAVAVTPSRIGVYEGASEVRGPFVLTPNVPPFVAPGDEFVVSTGLFNNLAEKAEVTLTLATSPGLSVVGNPSMKVLVEPQREGVGEFRLKATGTLGSADLTFSADSRGGTAKIRETLSVRPATPYRVALRTGYSTEKSLTLPVQRNLHDEYRKVELGYDRSPLVWAHGLATYLADYPYSCTEQLLSKAMPALVWATPETLARGDFRPVTDAFSILRQRQNEEGGFGMWAGDLEVEPQISVYAADFLAEAKERGIATPSDLEQHTRIFLEGIAGGPAEGLSELRTRAQAIYLLTRQGVVTTGPLAATVEQLENYHRQTWRTDLAAAYLAASHALLKQNREAVSLLGQVPWRSIGKDGTADEIYYDDLVHDAELLTLTIRHFPGRLETIPASLLDALGKRLSKDQYNSLSAALLIRALDLYGRSAAADNGPLAAEVEVKGARQPLQMQGRPPRTSLPQGWKNVFLNQDSAGLPAFYLISEAGFDRQPPSGELQQGIEILRDYLSTDGQPLAQVQVGSEFMVRLRLRATEREAINEVAIVDLLPGGVEPVSDGATEEASAEADDTSAETAAADSAEAAAESSDPSSLQPDFVDKRDDRVVMYTTLRRDVGTYAYRVRAINAGRFQTPPPYAEGMYERTLQGRGTGGTLTIVKP